MLKATIFLIINQLLFLGLIAQTSKPAETLSSKSLTKSFICEEIMYPEEDLQQGVEGTVKLKFIVGEDGQVSHISIIESVSEAIDKETIRIFRMIQWLPAIRYGNPIASEVEYSFPYNIKKYKKKCKQRGYNALHYPFKPVDTSYIVYSPKQTDRNPKPIFSSRIMNFSKFVAENLEYPDPAFRQDITGTVTLEFIVETHGRVSNITIKNAVGGGCNEEAIRILKLINWMPGIKDNMAVRTRMAIDISFELSTESEHKMYDYNTGSSI
jgi:protein TonB